MRLKAQVWTSCVGQLLSLSPQAGELRQQYGDGVIDAKASSLKAAIVASEQALQVKTFPLD